MKIKKTIAVVLLGLLVVASSAFCVQVTLHTSDDSFVSGAGPNANYGGNTFMRIRHQSASDWGNYFPLAKFDLSPLPSNIVVNSARMRYYVALTDDGGPGWPAADDFPAVAAYNNLQDWAEGTVTYNNRPTSDAAAADTLDHFGLISVDEVYFTSPNTISSGGWLEYVGAGMVSLVQDWANGITPNYGVTIKGTGDYTDTSRYFDLQSKENGNPAVHPTIIVDYTVIPEPATFGLIGCLVALFIARKR